MSQPKRKLMNIIQSGRILLIMVALVVVYGQTQWFRVPPPKVLISDMEPGSADFAWTFTASLAFKHGENPYFHDNKQFFDPYERTLEHEGRTFHIGYPPSHFLLYLPITYLTEDWKQAANIFFAINFMLIVFLAWLISEYIRDLTLKTPDVLILPVLILILGCFESTHFALERGQAGLVNSSIIWSGLLCFTRKRFVLSGFLVLCAAALKGYGAFLWIALFFIALGQGNLRHFLIGTGFGFIVFVLPVVHLIPDALEVMRKLLVTAGVTANPLAYSFRNLAAGLSLEWIKYAGIYSSYLAGIIVFLRIKTLPDDTETNVQLHWLIAMTLCLVLIPLGSSNVSYNYSLVLLVPGYLLLGFSYERRMIVEKPPGYTSMLMFGLLVIINLLVFKINLRGVSSSGIANLVYLIVIGISAVMSMLMQRKMEKRV